MSSPEQALVSLFTQFAFSFDGAVLGVALACAAVRTVLNFTTSSSALDALRKAPYVRVSDLRSIIPVGNSEQSESDQKFVVVRGIVEAKSSVEGNWTSLKPNVLVSQESGDRAVVVQRTQTCLYNEWKGFFGWTSDLRAIFARSLRKQESTSIRTVPFVLVEGGSSSSSDVVAVNMDGSKHPLPLTTVYHQLQPISATSYTFLQILLGHEHPVALLDEEKILPLGKDISAVGVCSFKDEIPVIKSCEDFPFFLSELSKDQMILDLVFRTRLMFWGSIVLGSLSIGILGYSVVRNWNRWKEWRQRSPQGRSVLGQLLDDSSLLQDSNLLQDSSPDDTGVDGDNAETVSDEGEVSADVPNGSLCVICLTRRRRSAFIPCGHLVCCERCVISVERDSTPKCPVCRQPIRNSVRIFES